MRGETSGVKIGVWKSPFQSTPLMRGETCSRVVPRQSTNISIHSPHARGDSNSSINIRLILNFNPLPSCEGRREQSPFFSLYFNFNPLPSCEGRLVSVEHLRAAVNFNPLPSCEGRHAQFNPAFQPKRFQSTPLMRGETPAHGGQIRVRHFNPLPSCEGRLI